MHQHSARVSGTRSASLRNACQRGAEVLAVGKVRLAYALGCSRANQLNLPQELNVELHATLTFLARRLLRDPGHHRKVKLALCRSFQNHAVGVHQPQFGALAQEGNRRSFHQLNPDAVRQDALDAGLLDPRNFLERRAPFGQRNPQDSAPAVGIELLQHGAAVDVVVAGQLDLLGTRQHDPRRVQEEMKRLVEQPATGHRSRPASEHALAELPASPTESPLADVQGFLATQILGLFFGEGIGLEGSSNFTDSIISSGAKEVWRYSKLISLPRSVWIPPSPAR